jgi:hypothetical protein
VGLLERRLQAFRIHVSVDLGSGNVRVSEHLLYAHDLGAVFEQVRGETVPQHVRARLAFPADFA